MSFTNLKLRLDDGLTLAGRAWTTAEPKAGVLLVHGFGEHSGRYPHVVDALNAAGFSVTAYDLRGHGESEGRRGWTPSYDRLVADLFQCLENVRKQEPELPLFLYGHSLGGGLALRCALDYRPQLAGIVCTSPLLRLAYEPPAWKTAALKLLNALRIPCSLASGLDDTALSRDLNVIRTYRNDPLTHNRISPALAAGMLAAGRRSLEQAAQLPCPLLLMHGDADRITDPGASQKFAARAGDRCTLKIWKGFYHELHNEPEKQEVLAHITDWLKNGL